VIETDEYSHHHSGGVWEYRLMHLSSNSPMDDREWVEYEKTVDRRAVGIRSGSSSISSVFDVGNTGV
jgi:hypothetical protein